MKGERNFALLVNLRLEGLLIKNVFLCIVVWLLNILNCERFFITFVCLNICVFRFTAVIFLLLYIFIDLRLINKGPYL